MSNRDKPKWIENFQLLREKFENKSKQGIVFKIYKEKTPSEIIGVLNFLKYKIQKWKNTNIFSYSGDLFEGETIIVVGGNNIDDSIYMIIFVFLNEVLEKKIPMPISKIKIRNLRNIELFLIEELSSKIKVGLPAYPNLENEIKNHLERILKNKIEN
jgi:hypothetical protein